MQGVGLCLLPRLPGCLARAHLLVSCRHPPQPERQMGQRGGTGSFRTTGFRLTLRTRYDINHVPGTGSISKETGFC